LVEPIRGGSPRVQERSEAVLAMNTAEAADHRRLDGGKLDLWRFGQMRRLVDVTGVCPVARTRVATEEPPPEFAVFGLCGGPAGRRLQGKLFCRFHHDRCPIRQHLGHPLHHLSGVIARADDCVATQFGSVLQHQVKGLGPGFLAEIG
jgi:hypothetical protein